MNNETQNTNEYYIIDIAHILKTLWSKAWLIAIVACLSAAIGFAIATFAITPQYSSSTLLYVNNSSFSLGNTSFSISSSEITAAQSLVKTYTVMLKNRTTLQQVIEKSGVSYTYEELYDMIEASSVNDTEVLMVTVTTDDPYKSATIVNCIAEVLPNRIAEIVEGSSMEVVDFGIANHKKVSPSITKYTAVGFLLGFIVSVVVVIILALLDNTIHDEEYVLKTYNYPILAKVPDLMQSNSKRYGYYYQSKRGTSEKKVNENDDQ